MIIPDDNGQRSAEVEQTLRRLFHRAYAHEEPTADELYVATMRRVQDSTRRPRRHVLTTLLASKAGRAAVAAALSAVLFAVAAVAAVVSWWFIGLGAGAASLTTVLLTDLANRVETTRVGDIVASATPVKRYRSWQLRVDQPVRWLTVRRRDFVVAVLLVGVPSLLTALSGGTSLAIAIAALAASAWMMVLLAADGVWRLVRRKSPEPKLTPASDTEVLPAIGDETPAAVARNERAEFENHPSASSRGAPLAGQPSKEHSDEPGLPYIPRQRGAHPRPSGRSSSTPGDQHEQEIVAD